MAQHHHVLGNMPQKYHYTLPCDDLAMMQTFVNDGIDLRMFDVTRCRSPECLKFLLENGYEIDMPTFRHLLLNCPVDVRIQIIKVVMDNQDIVSKLDLDTCLYSCVDLSVSHYAEKKIMFEFIAANYPHILVGTKFFTKNIEFASIFDQHINFTQRELYEDMFENDIGRRDGISIIKILKYCDPADYLNDKMYCTLFSDGCTSVMEHFIKSGFEPIPKEFGKLSDQSIKSLQYLESEHALDMKTFDWDLFKKYGEPAFLSFYAIDWLKRNGWNG
jgi:hypothetical protein